MIKYIKSVLWRVAKCLSYIEEARCLKVKLQTFSDDKKGKAVPVHIMTSYRNEEVAPLISNIGIVWDEASDSRPGRLNPQGKNLEIHGTAGWMGPIANMGG